MTPSKILVWDLPTRVFHWLLAISFAGAYLTAESESWRLVHVTLGYSFGGLILFRLVWGLIGSRHARFAAFAYGPRRLLEYLRSLLQQRPQHFTGHNPAGSWAIYAMLGLGLGVALSGYALYSEIGGEAFEEVHEVLSNVLLGIVIIHVLGVILASRMHGENLARSMVTGVKHGDPADAIHSARTWVGVLLGAVVLAFWLDAFGTRTALVGAPVADASSSTLADRAHDRDDDHDDD